ncbi:MAG: PaaI family thioesterase [Actinomycetota bacterium]
MARTRWDAIVDGSVRMPANDALGFALEDTPDPQGSISLSWRVPDELCNSAGNLQGGVLAAFADALLGGATSAHLSEDTYPALAEMKISVFRPARRNTTLLGRGYVVKSGRRLLFAEAEVRDPDGNLIARASGTEIPTPA